MELVHILLGISLIINIIFLLIIIVMIRLNNRNEQQLKWHRMLSH